MNNRTRQPAARDSSCCCGNHGAHPPSAPDAPELASDMLNAQETEIAEMRCWLANTPSKANGPVERRPAHRSADVWHTCAYVDWPRFNAPGVQIG